MIQFTAHGQPHPAERPRKVRRGRGAAWITPDTSLAAQAAVAAAYRATHPGRAPLDQPLVLEVAFHRATYRWADVDNLVKTVQDGLNGVAYTDDRLIVAVAATRVMGVPPERARTVVTLHPLAPGECATLEVVISPEPRREDP